ncbi:MAG: hypothetical protein HY238_05660 [Acidobacteria bacterium]|nr:hypothetical protein [Acidobacteriota bacterium]
MSHDKSPGHIDLNQVFLYVQREMLARLASGGILEHGPTSGTTTEHQWIELFNQYLPNRYRASSAFIVDADGRRSRQIDIAIYDNLYSPLLFPCESGLHIPAESVYAVFEVKQALTPAMLRDAGLKAASVRALRRTSVPVRYVGGEYPPKPHQQILAGILACRAAWSSTFHWRLNAALRALPPDHRLDLGCALGQGSFELIERPEPLIYTSSPQDALIFFILRLLERLRILGSVPAADLMQYARHLPSFSALLTLPPA